MLAKALALMISLAWIVTIGCGERKREVIKDLDRETALREWKINESIVAEAIEGRYQEDRILNSVIFFHELTGITVHGDGTAIGYILDENARDDLIRIQEWCKMHCDEIYWDESARKVKRLSSGGEN